MSFNSAQHLHQQEIEKKNQQEPQQLLLAREPQDELIDFGEIAGFLREKHDDLGNSLSFGHHQNHLYPHQLNFEDKHNNQGNIMYQHHTNNDHNNKYTFLNDHNAFQRNQQQLQQEEQALNSPIKYSIAHKRKCICKKTRCLKMYCECFASGLPCTEECTCISCKNTLDHQKEIIEAKMLIQEKGIVGLHSCSLSQKRCNCKKSGCLKKYCECYNSGVKCTRGCKCIDCKNCQNPNEDKDQNKEVQQKQQKVRKSKKKEQKGGLSLEN